MYCLKGELSDVFRKYKLAWALGGNSGLSHWKPSIVVCGKLTHIHSHVYLQVINISLDHLIYVPVCIYYMVYVKRTKKVSSGFFKATLTILHNTHGDDSSDITY